MEKYGEEPGFSVEHNKRIIAQSIKDTEANYRRKGREKDEDYRERASAAASFIQNAQSGDGAQNVKGYFGKDYLSYLQGKKTIDRLMDRLQVVGRDGKIIRRANEIK